MLKTIASIGLGAAIALSPLAAFAQPALLPGAPAHHLRHYTEPEGRQGEKVLHPHHVRHYAGSYRSKMRYRSNLSKEQARAGAEQMRTMHNQ